MGVAAYPGTFNPLTVAHLAVAEAAARDPALDRVDLIVARTPLAKTPPATPCLDHRVEVLRRAAATRPWLGVVVTDVQLIVDQSAGYDAVVMGADKWAQIHDPAFYGGSERERDAAIARLPRVLVVPRPPTPLPVGQDVLDIDPAHAPTSSTAVLAGRREWMAPEALAFDDDTGAWSDPERYTAWCRTTTAPAPPSS